MPLSSRLAVAIVAAELDGLAETLASARSFATQVVVAVATETPETGMLARTAGAQVVNLPADTSPADARNACLHEVTARWVLWLEPGERIVATGIDALEELLAEASSCEQAYRCLVCTPGVGQQAALECRAELRLHPRLSQVRFTGLVRESIEEALQAAGCKIETLNLKIERPGSPSEAARRLRRAQGVLRQANAALDPSQRTPRVLNGLAESFQIIGDAGRAAELYRAALDLAANRSADELEAWYGLLTSLDGVAGGRAAQLQLCMQALESFPVDAQLLCALGGYLQAQGHVDLSAQAYFVAWKHGQVSHTVEHLADIREIGAACHAAALAQLGQRHQACRFLHTALEKDPDSARLQLALQELSTDDDVQLDHRSRTLRLDAAGPMRAGPSVNLSADAPQAALKNS